MTSNYLNACAYFGLSGGPGEAESLPVTRARRPHCSIPSLGIAAAAILVLGIMAVPAQAQTPVTGPFPSWPGGSLEPAAVGPLSETVFRRARPDYDPLGVRWESFIINPSLDVSALYDSNVFATDSGQKSDVTFVFVPAMSIVSDWNRHAVSASVSGDFQKHVNLTSEDVNNMSTDVGGRYDISNGEYISADALYQLLHEARQSPNAVFGVNPTEYHVMGYDLAYVHMTGQVGFRIDNTLTSYSFNNPASQGGGSINQAFRDRNEWVIAPRVQYEIQPGYNAFIRALGNERQYFSQEPGAGPQGQAVRRNSHGWEVDVGTAIEITRITSAEIYVGYLHQYYENPLLKSPSGMGFGGNLIWNVTPLTTVRGSFSQSVAETTLTGASSSLETGVQLTIEHELLRNLLLLGSIGYVHDDYQGNPRVDNTFGVDLGVKYLLTRNWTATADINYSQRDTNQPPASGTQPGGNYNRFTAIAGIKYAF